MKSLSVVLISLFLFSCSQQTEEKQSQEKPLSYTYNTVERTHPNCGNQDDERGCVELRYTYPIFTDSDNLPIVDTLQTAVQDFLFDSTRAPISEASFDKMAREWFSLYDSTLTELPDYNLPWEHTIQIRLIYQTPSLLSVEFSEYEFMGGTHGSEIKIYQMYGIPSGEQLNLSDVLLEDKKDQLAILAEEAFREQKKFPDNVEYDERDYHFRDGIFGLNQNYALTEEGLLFHYNPYEVAPYSEGPTRLLLPYEQIDSLLTDTVKPSSVFNNESVN